MAAGLTDRVWSMDEIVGMIDEAAPKPGRPKTYKKREAPKSLGLTFGTHVLAFRFL